LLAGCGNSKKGNSYLPQLHHAHPSAQILTSL
jgi:hypothetical protein